MSGDGRDARRGLGGRVARHSRRFAYLLILVAIAAFASFVHALAALELPDVEALVDETSILFDRNGVEIARFHGEENRVPLQLHEISPILINAVIASEDRDFLTHYGVDPVAIGRAAWADIRSEGALQGGSTITQQYVKNAFLTPERTLSRKLKEAALAIKLEREVDKGEILEGYLNTIYFGRGAYGIEAASRAWFGIRASELDIGQSAYLAGLIRAPELADISRPSQVEEAYRRRDSVLEAMLDEGYISPAEWADVDLTPIEGYTLPRSENSSTQVSEVARVSGAEYVVDSIRQELQERYGDQVLYRGGLRITTTLDLGLQLEVHQIALEVLRHEDDPTAAIVVLDEQGGVRAMVGGKNFAESEVNLALGGAATGGVGRQAGSTFKPVVLAQAVVDGISVRSRFVAPNRLELPGLDGGETWVVRNYEGKDFGIIDLMEATRESVNTVYAQLIDEVGPASVASLGNRLGVTSSLSAFHSLALGAQEVSVLDMATVYATFAGRGERHDPLLVMEVRDRDGEVLDRFASSPTRVLSTQEADVVTDVLKGVVEGGSGIGGRIDGLTLAGKTGTSQDFRDAWFVGYSPRFTTAVWLGYPDSTRSMIDVLGIEVVTGGSFPAVIWRQVMEAAHLGVDAGSFVSPDSYPGSIIGLDLVPTSSTLLPEDDPSATSTPAASTTAAPRATTTTTTTSTTAPAVTTTADPDG